MKKLLLSLALAASVAVALPQTAQPVYAAGGGYAGSSYTDYVRQYITLHLSYGDRYGYYEGEVNAAGLPDGEGRFTSSNKGGGTWVYEGSFRNGHMEGEGAMTWPGSGHRREGVHRNDEITGYGRLIDLKKDKVIYEGQMLRDMPLYEEVSMRAPVRYDDYQVTISDAYLDDRLGYTRAHGQFLIVLANIRNVSRDPVVNLTSGEWLKLWDKTNDRVYDADRATMKRYYGDYNDAGWIDNNLQAGASTGKVAIAFDVDKNFDEDNCCFLIYGGFLYFARPIRLEVR